MKSTFFSPHMYVTAAYLSWVGQHCYRGHEAGRQGHGHRQGHQFSLPCQEVPGAFTAPAGPGVVHPDGSGDHQHERKHHIVLCY